MTPDAAQRLYIYEQTENGPGRLLGIQRLPVRTIDDQPRAHYRGHWYYVSPHVRHIRADKIIIPLTEWESPQ